MHPRALRGILKTLRDFPEVSELSLGGEEPVTIKVAPRAPAPRPQGERQPTRVRSAIDSLRDPDPVFEVPS